MAMGANPYIKKASDNLSCHRICGVPAEGRHNLSLARFLFFLYTGFLPVAVVHMYTSAVQQMYTSSDAHQYRGQMYTCT